MMARMSERFDWLLDPPEGQARRRIAIIAVILFAWGVFTTGASFMGFAYSLIAADNTAAIEQNGDVADCRSLFNSRLVGTAAESLDAARAELDLLETELLEAAARQDSAEVSRIADELDPAQGAIGEAVDVLRAGRLSYNALIELSLDDRTEFLDQCEREKNGD